MRKFTSPSQGLKASEDSYNFFTSIVFSPDGKTLAGGSETETGAATQGGQKARKTAVKLWDVATGREVRELGHLDRPILSIAYSPDGKGIAVSTWDADGGGATGVKLFDVETGKLLRLLAKDERRNFEQLAFSPDGKLLVSVTAVSSEVQRWDVATGVEVKGGDIAETNMCLPMRRKVHLV